MPYPTDHETLTRFVAARLREAPESMLANTDLAAAVAMWCASQEVPPISHQRASRFLLSLGYRQHSNRENGRRWVGLTLRDPVAAE